MISERLAAIKEQLPSGVKLVAVSKFHPGEEILQAFQAGQRLFGENRPQELARKAVQLPPEIEWHFIGHLQTNKLKLVLPYVAMVESVDSLHLLQAIEDWCAARDRTVRVLLEVHIGAEETKGGFLPEEVLTLMQGAWNWPHVLPCGLMGMASHTSDEAAVRADFARIRALFDAVRRPGFTELSIGMSDDWKLALDYGATIVRIGTAIFGPRVY